MAKVIDNPPAPRNDREKIPVLVVLTKTDMKVADTMTVVRDSTSRSDYIRKLIRADYRRHMRRQQKQVTT